jgi:hypothetical protein
MPVTTASNAGEPVSAEMPLAIELCLTTKHIVCNSIPSKGGFNASA